MAKVWRQDGFVFRIYSNDHDPSHVHVSKAEERIVINIGSQETAPYLKKSGNNGKKNAIKAIKIVAENQAHLLKRWRDIHG